MKYYEILTFYQGVITYVVNIFLCSFCFTLALQNNMTLNKTTIIVTMLLDSFFSCFFSSRKNICLEVSQRSLLRILSTL